MKSNLNNDAFIRENLTKIVRKYPRQRIVVSNGKIFTGPKAVKLARKAFPKTVPLSFPVPAAEEFPFHLL